MLGLKSIRKGFPPGPSPRWEDQGAHGHPELRRGCPFHSTPPRMPKQGLPAADPLPLSWFLFLSLLECPPLRTPFLLRSPPVSVPLHSCMVNFIKPQRLQGPLPQTLLLDPGLNLQSSPGVSPPPPTPPEQQERQGQPPGATWRYVGSVTRTLHTSVALVASAGCSGLFQLWD